MKRNYILSVVAVLLIVSIGFTFAYFMSGVRVDGDGSSTSGDTANLIEVEYDAGSEVVDASGVVPGDIITKEFDIIIRPTEIEKEATYAIKLDIENNTFVKCDDSNYDSITNACTKDAEELVYRLKGNDNEVIAEGTLMGLTGEQTLIVETKEVNSETTYHYTLEIEFVETNADQNHNENKTFSGRVIVEFAEEGILLKDQILADNTLQTTTPDFSKTAQADCTGINNCEETNGLYQTEDNYGTTYYFRGAVDNNWVSFAGFYWRIIRINGDGSIRLIYSGDSSSGPVETGEATQIGTSAFNEQYNDNAYVGYMYGTPGSDTYEETHANTNDSTIKTVLDNWYQENLLSYSSYISTEAGFCGDREPSTDSSTSNGLGGTGLTETYYGTYMRLITNKLPTFECQNDSDLYTISSSRHGNKALDYPIGLITADEVAFVGGLYGQTNQEFYLYTNRGYWTITPYALNSNNIVMVLAVDSNGVFQSVSINNMWDIRPVINLDKNVTISSGDGTIDNPYVVGA